MNITLATRLKQLRQERHLHQEQLAAQIGVVPSAIGNYEAGTREPPYNTLVKLASVYGVSTDYLLGRTDRRWLDISGLSSDEAALITALVQGMRDKNNKLEVNL